MTSPLLDTHAWIWWLDHNKQLDPKTIAHLERFPADSRPLLSAISLWEVATLRARGRFECRPSFEAWLERAADSSTVQILPITTAIAGELVRLPASFHHDPADRIIVATARVHDLPLVTMDRAIRASKLVRLWRHNGPPSP